MGCEWVAPVAKKRKKEIRGEGCWAWKKKREKEIKKRRWAWTELV